MPMRRCRCHQQLAVDQLIARRDAAAPIDEMVDFLSRPTRLTDWHCHYLLGARRQMQLGARYCLHAGQTRYDCACPQDSQAAHRIVASTRSPASGCSSRRTAPAAVAGPGRARARRGAPGVRSDVLLCPGNERAGGARNPIVHRHLRLRQRFRRRSSRDSGEPPTELHDEACSSRASERASAA